jgi:hypothetical protein
MIDDAHYLVRFEAGSDGSPEALAVVALDDMVRAGLLIPVRETPGDA